MRWLWVVSLVLATACSGSSTKPPAAAVVKITTGGQPCGVASAGGSVWISDAADGRLLRLDPATHAVTVADTLDATPCEMTEAFGALWVTTQSGFLDRVDLLTGKVTGHAPTGLKSYEAEPAAGALWVSDRSSAQLTRVDPTTMRTSVLPLPGTSPGGLVFAFGALWVGDDTAGATALLKIDLGTRKVTRVPAGHRPAYVTATSTDVWVSESEDGTVSRIDPTTLARTTVKTGTSPVNLDVLGDDVWVPDDVANTVVRISGGKVVQTVTADGLGPAVVAPVRAEVWATMFTGGQVWAITPTPS